MVVELSMAQLDQSKENVARRILIHFSEALLSIRLVCGSSLLVIK